MIFFGKNEGKENIYPKRISKLEEELDRLKENFLYTQKLTKIGSWTYYIDTDQVFWSEEIYDLLGLSKRGELRHLEDFYKFIHSEDLEKVVASVSIALEGKEYDIEFRIIDSKGNIRFFKGKN